jgi:thiamine biosynthesis lipoprotein
VFGDCTLPVVRREADGTLRPLGGLCNAALASSAVRSGRDPRFPALIVDPNGAGVAPAVWSVLAASAWRADALTKVAALAPAAARAQTVLRFGGRLIEAGAGVCA